MATIRGILGAIAGAAIALLALRVRHHASQSGMSMIEAAAELPRLLRDDAGLFENSARAACNDGRDAAHTAEREMDKVLYAERRTTHNGNADV